VGDLRLHAEAVGYNGHVSAERLVFTGIEGRKTHGAYFPSRAQGVGVSAGRFLAGRPRDWIEGR
jgi:hypothetical protein